MKASRGNMSASRASGTSFTLHWLLLLIAAIAAWLGLWTILRDYDLVITYDGRGNSAYQVLATTSLDSLPSALARRVIPLTSLLFTGTFSGVAIFVALKVLRRSRYGTT